MQPGVLNIPSMKERCSAAEWQARVDLAACYRLVAHYEMNDLIANGIRETDPKKRGEIYREIVKLANDDVPWVPMIQAKVPYALNPGLKGFVYHPVWFVTLANLSR